MDCQKIKKLIPIYLDQELEAADHRQVEAHLRTCSDCRAEARALEKSWEMLGEVPEIAPDPHYQGRFWRAVDAQMPWSEKILQNVQAILGRRRWIPALAATAAIVSVSSLVAIQFLHKPNAIQVLAELNEAELEMIANIDLAEHYDIIEDLDFFSDLEIIESLDNLDEFETS